MNSPCKNMREMNKEERTSTFCFDTVSISCSFLLGIHRFLIAMDCRFDLFVKK